MRVALVATKGGAGKSTLAIALASEAHARGLRVLLVDGDADQGTCLVWGETAAANGHAAPEVVKGGDRMHEQLARAPHDVVVVDTPGRSGSVQRSALLAVDVALVPTSPNPSDAWALAATLDTIKAAQAVRPALRVAVVLNRVRPRTAVGKLARGSLTAAGVPVLRTEVADRIAWPEAVGLGRGVTMYDRGEAALEARRLFDELAALAAGGRT